MIYLSGSILPGIVAGELPIGLMLTPRMRQSPDLTRVRAWAADTGCFSQPQDFRLDQYLCWLADRLQWADTCLFATAPDRFGDGPATLAVAVPVLPLIRRVGFRAALVTQPGVDAASVPWGEFDSLFIGGPDWWQNSKDVADLIDAASARGLWVHRGRVNSYKRLQHAADMGAKSADGTYLRYGPDINLPRLMGWLKTMEERPTLFGLVR